jgi:HEAT repeat protein
MANISVQQKAVAVLILVNTAITNLRLYPPTSAMIRSTIDRLCQAFSAAFEETSSMDFAESERSMLVCGEPLGMEDMERPQVRAFLELLLGFEIRSLSFEKGLENEELLRLLPILSKKPETVAAEGGLQKAFDEARLTHILLGRKIYVAKDQDQQIIASLAIRDEDIIKYLSESHPELKLDPQKVREMARDAEWATEIFQTGMTKIMEQKGKLPDTQLSANVVRMIDMLNKVVGPEDQERIAHFIATAVAHLDPDLASLVLAQDIGDLFGGRIFQDVVEQMDGQKFSQVMEKVRSMESRRTDDPQAFSEEGNSVVPGVYERMLASARGLELQREQQEREVREKEEREIRVRKIEKEIEPLLKGEEGSFLNRSLMSSLPEMHAQLTADGEKETAEALLSSVVEALLSKGESVRSEAAAALVRIIDGMPPERQEAFVIEKTETFLKWVRLETAATPAYKQICQRLKNQAQEQIRQGRLAECIPVLDLFYRIETGLLEKNDTAHAAAVQIIQELASPENLEILFRYFSQGDETNKACAVRLLGRLGENALNQLLDILRDHNDSQERVRILNVFAEIGKPAVPVIRGRIDPDESWYFLRNLAYILGRIPSDATAVALKPLLLHKEEKVRQEAMKSLFKAGGGERGPVLLAMLPVADDTFKLDVVEMLGSIRYAGAVPSLVEILSTRPLITPAARIDLEEKICVALGKIGSPEAVPALREVVKPKGFLKRSVYPDKVRNAASLALTSIGNSR